MTFGEQLFFGLVLATFMIFGVTLAVVASSTNRYMRRKESEARENDSSLSRAT